MKAFLRGSTPGVIAFGIVFLVGVGVLVWAALTKRIPDPADTPVWFLGRKGLALLIFLGLSVIALPIAYAVERLFGEPTQESPPRIGGVRKAEDRRPGAKPAPVDRTDGRR